MSIIGILVVLCVVGLLLWAVESIIPMDPQIAKIIRVVAIVLVCLWLLQAFGLLGGGPYLGTTMRTGPAVVIR